MVKNLNELITEGSMVTQNIWRFMLKKKKQLVKTAFLCHFLSLESRKIIFITWRVNRAACDLISRGAAPVDLLFPRWQQNISVRIITKQFFFSRLLDKMLTVPFLWALRVKSKNSIKSTLYVVIMDQSQTWQWPPSGQLHSEHFHTRGPCPQTLIHHTHPQVNAALKQRILTQIMHWKRLFRTILTTSFQNLYSKPTTTAHRHHSKESSLLCSAFSWEPNTHTLRVWAGTARIGLGKTVGKWAK